ncbi:MAG: uroporphyrinogen decarboxylase family protein [Actinomycetota bacterium]
MNSREKFNHTLSFDSVSSIPKAEFGYWAGTIKDWGQHGLPLKQKIPEDALDGDLVRGSTPLYKGSGELVDRNVMPYLGLDSYLTKFPFDISPRFKTQVIEDNKDEKIYTDNFGLTAKVSKKAASTPMVLKYPIKNKNDFYRYRSYYDDNFKKRLPPNWEKLQASLAQRDFPIRLGGGPFGFSFLGRHLMGEVDFMLNMYDDPQLIKEFNQFYTDFVMSYWAKILEKVDIDCIFILEDVAYRSGSFISREMFMEFLAPYYKKFIDFLKQYRIENIFVDCDGKIEELIPLWIDAGVTGIFPIEAVNDIAQVREAYPGLKLLGGFDKKLLFEGSSQEKIDAKLKETKQLMLGGGYIPHVDHAVSADCTWSNFKYYRQKLNDIIDSIGGKK